MSVTKVADNTDDVLAKLKESIGVALEAVGLKAEGDVKRACPVDTGLLRNSITHAVAGQSPALASYQANGTHASTAITRQNGTAGTPVNPIKKGGYEKIAVGSEEENAVYIGTNVEYAPYVEMGTSRTKAQPFLKPTIEKNKEAYKQIMQDYIAKNMT